MIHLWLKLPFEIVYKIWAKSKYIGTFGLLFGLGSTLPPLTGDQDAE
jgi:hypothetical protein